MTRDNPSKHVQCRLVMSKIEIWNRANYIRTIKTFGGRPKGYFHFLLSPFKVKCNGKKERNNCESIYVAFDLMIILNRLDNSNFN